MLPTAPWLSIAGDEVALGAANGMLRKVPQQINLISIFGAARGGKSTMMSLLCGQPGLFKASPGGEAFTTVPAGEEPGKNEHLRLYAGSTGMRQYQVPEGINAEEKNCRTTEAIVATPPARVPHHLRR